MTYSTSRLSFDDVFEFMEQAFEASERDKVLRIPFRKHDNTVDNRGAAIQFRGRIHQARVIDRKDNLSLYPDKEHPLHGRSKYDILSAEIRKEDGEIFLYLRKRHLKNLKIEEVDDLPASREPERIDYEETKLIEGPDKISRRF